MLGDKLGHSIGTVTTRRVLRNPGGGLKKCRGVPRQARRVINRAQPARRYFTE